MATTAHPVKENIAGEFALNTVYYKYNPQGFRQWLLRKGTNVEFTNWWKKTTQWFQQEAYEGGDIKNFIEKYSLDMTDYAKEKPSDYENFNEFFYREFKDGVRKIDLRDEIIVSPADCKVRVLPNITATSKFFVKQVPFNLAAFLDDACLAEQYEGGTLFTFRLAPTDYHRFHFPFDCTPSVPLFIKGEYETVNPIAFRVGLWPVVINKRARITLHSPVFGDVIMMVVGASMVASLNFTYTFDAPVKKGSEAGFFAFGGSTVCLLFKKDVIQLPDLLVVRSENKHLDDKKDGAIYEKKSAFETAVRVGQGVAGKSGKVDVNSLTDPRYVAFLHKNTKTTTLHVEGAHIHFAWNEVAKVHPQTTF
jgi:phosphatidylserine decarboxylase